MAEKTNIELKECSEHIWKDEKGFYIYITIRSFPVTLTGVKAYITDEGDIQRAESLYKGGRQ